MDYRQREVIDRVRNVWDWDTTDSDRTLHNLIDLIQVYGYELTDDERAEVEGELSYLVRHH